MGSEKVFGTTADKVLLTPEPQRQTPALLLWPKDPPTRARAVVIAAPQGKDWVLLHYWPLIESLRERGTAVMVVDAGFHGELEAEWKWTQVIGRRPIAGIAADDIRAANAYLRQRAGIEPSQITCVGLGDEGVSVLLAAAMDKNISATAALRLGRTYASGREEPFLPNILKYGDLPQIASLVAPRPLFLAGVNEIDFKSVASNKNLRLESDTDSDGQKFLSWLDTLGQKK